MNKNQKKNDKVTKSSFSNFAMESVQQLLNGLAGINQRALIPRKLKLLQNYIQQNLRSLIPNDNSN